MALTAKQRSAGNVLDRHLAGALWGVTPKSGAGHISGQVFSRAGVMIPGAGLFPFAELTWADNRSREILEALSTSDHRMGRVSRILRDYAIPHIMNQIARRVRFAMEDTDRAHTILSTKHIRVAPLTNVSDLGQATRKVKNKSSAPLIDTGTLRRGIKFTANAKGQITITASRSRIWALKAMEEGNTWTITAKYKKFVLAMIHRERQKAGQVPEAGALSRAATSGAQAKLVAWLRVLQIPVGRRVHVPPRPIIRPAIAAVLDEMFSHDSNSPAMYEIREILTNILMDNIPPTSVATQYRHKAAGTTKSGLGYAGAGSAGAGTAGPIKVTLGGGY